MRAQRYLRALETTTQSRDVWKLITDLGREIDLPMIDFISASDYRDWTRTLFIRTSYDATWLHEANADPEVHRWSYFRSHGINCLTPITVGIEFVDDYRPLPPVRVALLEKAAAHGMRAGISIPLRQHAPPAAAMLTFAGDHSRQELLDILARDGWTLTLFAWAAHQRYLQHFSEEFFERNRVTDKQRELLEMIGSGYLDKQIAEVLDISVSAVRQRLNALMQKTPARNRAELAALAMSLGVLPDPLNRPDNGPITVVESDVTGEYSRDYNKWPHKS